MKEGDQVASTYLPVGPMIANGYLCTHARYFAGICQTRGRGGSRPGKEDSSLTAVIHPLPPPNHFHALYLPLATHDSLLPTLYLLQCGLSVAGTWSHWLFALVVLTRIPNSLPFMVMLLLHLLQWLVRSRAQSYALHSSNIT